MALSAPETLAWAHNKMSKVEANEFGSFDLVELIGELQVHSIRLEHAWCPSSGVENYKRIRATLQEFVAVVQGVVQAQLPEEQSAWQHWFENRDGIERIEQMWKEVEAAKA